MASSAQRELIRTVNWKNTTLPGTVCGSTTPVALHAGTATFPAPRALGDVGTADVVVNESSIIYGDLDPTAGTVAALNIGCSNTGGTADGEIQDSWVLFSGAPGHLNVIGTLTPQNPSSPAAHTPYFDTRPGGISLRPGRISVKELSYGPSDGTCCPSVKTTTHWLYSRGSLRPVRPPTSRGPSAAQIRDILDRTTTIGPDLHEHFARPTDVVTISDGAGGTITALAANGSNSGDGKGWLVFFWHGDTYIGSATSRTVIDLSDVTTAGPQTFAVDYLDYALRDALCCPSKPSLRVTYRWNGAAFTSSRTLPGTDLGVSVALR